MYVVFIIPRLIEKAQKDTAVVWNGRERDVYSSTLPRGIGRDYDTRHVNHEIVRIAGLDLVTESGGLRFSSSSRALDLSNRKGPRWRVARAIETHDLHVFHFGIGKCNGDIFPSVGRGVRGQRRISRQSHRYD